MSGPKVSVAYKDGVVVVKAQELVGAGSYVNVEAGVSLVDILDGVEKEIPASKSLLDGLKALLPAPPTPPAA